MASGPLSYQDFLETGLRPKSITELVLIVTSMISTFQGKKGEMLII